jgi:Spy/CpxP family protein refolding chaperone
MRKHTLILAAALVLTTALAAATAQTSAPGANQPVTVSPEELHRQVDGRSLPLTYIEDLY